MTIPRHYSHLSIKIIPGTEAPRYSQRTELNCEDVAITEQGTEQGLPIVDFRCKGPDGKFYLLVLTGRMCNMISAAVKGINKRNHGIEEP